MRRGIKTTALAACMAITLAPMAEAQGLMAAMIMKRMAKRAAEQDKASKAPPAPAAQPLIYGSDSMQVMDFTPPKAGTPSPAPLVVFVHGGGWTQGNKDNATGPWKAPHLTGLGYGFANINYRLVPRVTVEDQAADVALALAELIRQADKLGIDRRKIVLMGHSAGAHLVALVGTDERYLRAAGLSFADLAGVVPIDGAAYDVPRQMEDAGRFMADRYKQAFGTDRARQETLSPTLHAAAPNAPRFLLLHVQREDGVAQSKALADALRKAGTPVQINGFEGTGLKGHAQINHQLGDPDYPATPVLDAWLKAVFGR
jgi:arylformamidase